MDIEMQKLPKNEENKIIENEIIENEIIEHRKSCIRENSMGITFIISCIIGFIIVGWNIS